MRPSISAPATCGSWSFSTPCRTTAALINSGLYEGTQGIAEAVSSYDPSMLYAVLLYLIPTVILLRKSRLPEVAIFSEVEPPRPDPQPQSEI